MNPDQQLIDYISKNLNLGYDQQAISQTLLSSGYSQEQVNAAFDYLYAQSHYGTQAKANYTPGGHFGSKPMMLYVMIGVGVLLAIISGVLLFADSGSSSSDFQIDSVNTGSSTTTFEDVTTAEPEDDTQSSTTSTTTTQPNKSTSSQTSTSTSTSTSTTTSTTTTTSLSERELTRLEINKQVDEIAATNPDKALTLCAQILTQSGRSNCIIQVALESKQPSVCEDLTDEFVRDTCFMNFAIEEMGSIQTVCANVQDQLKQRSCVLLFNNFAESEELVKAQAAIEELSLAEQEAILQEAQTASDSVFG